jgi:peptide/nickel transport system substrate-binding protein
MTHPIAGGWAYNPSLDSLMQYDPEQAANSLAVAGDVAAGALTMTTDNTQLNQDICQVVQAQYQALGVNVQLETIDSAEYFAAVLDDEVSWGSTNWTPRADPDGTLRPLWYSTGFQNSTGYNNPEVDRLLDEAAGLYELEAAAEVYHEIERIIVEDAPYIFLTAPREFAAMQSTLGGFAFYPDLILRLKNLWLS